MSGPAGPRAGRASPWIRAFDWIFRDRRTGAVTIAQAPNLALWLFVAASLASVLARPTGTVRRPLEIAAALCLAWWAGDELLRGVNPWRRALGAGVLATEGYRWLA